MEGFVRLLFELLILGLIVAVFYWAFLKIAARLPEPVKLVIEVIMALIVIIFLLGFLGLGWQFPHRRW